MKCEKCHSEVPDESQRCPNCDAELSASLYGECEYAAFISYRHIPRDQEIAKQVQRSIETYTLPKSITMPGRLDHNLGKCFRDEDELAASHSLPSRIVEALEKSSSLIVVCSPEARDSLWINREIETFIAIHGRERIFTVLADGSSEESIPDSLRTQTAVLGGTPTPANPLAADFRPEAADKRREEALRIIAAVAGCSYDDLRQRGRSRTLKRRAIIACAIVLAIAVIAAAIAFASSAKQNALLSESRQLAAESSQLLARGDRYGAIQKALEALPASESSNDRPIVPEAVTALHNALEVNGNPDTIWQASYEIKTQAPLGLIENTLSHKSEETALAGAIAVSDTGGFFGVSDTEGTIVTYDTLTGNKLADCVITDEALPLSDGLFARTMEATQHYLFVASSGNNGSLLTCFDAASGETIFADQATGCPSFDNSYGADLVSMAFPLSMGGYQVLNVDVSTGTSSSAIYEGDSPVDTSSGYFNTPGARFGTNYAAFGNRLSKIELDSSQSNSVDLAYDCATSLQYVDGVIIAASAEPMPDDDITRQYAVEAFDESLNLLWRHEGDFTSEMIVDNGVTSLVSAEPDIAGATGDGKGIVLSVGREVLVLDKGTGNISNHFSFDQSVLRAYPTQGNQDDPGFIAIACCNGMISFKDLLPGAQDAAGDSRRLTLPFPIRWAQFVNCDGMLAIIALPADSDNSIVSFRTDFTRGKNAADEYSLDELIAMAHDVLAEGGVAP